MCYYFIYSEESLINLGCCFKVAKENKTTLPSAAMFIIRYHSFYGKFNLEVKVKIPLSKNSH